MSDNGIQLMAPYIGDGRALTGSQRHAEEARLRKAELERRADVIRRADRLKQKRRRTLAQIEALQAELDADEAELNFDAEAERVYLDQAASDRSDMEKSRRVAE
jgi:circadian clock protein KaiC